MGVCNLRQAMVENKMVENNQARKAIANSLNGSDRNYRTRLNNLRNKIHKDVQKYMKIAPNGEELVLVSHLVGRESKCKVVCLRVFH